MKANICRADFDFMGWKADHDLVELVRQTTHQPGTRSGSVYKFLCPFHSEKTPSLCVWHAPPQRWRCFGCGEGGDHFDYLIKLTNRPLSEIIEDLGHAPTVPPPASRPTIEPEFSIDLKTVRLWHKDAKEDYWSSQKVPPEVLGRFLVGFYRNRHTIPHICAENVLGVKLRRSRDDQRPKYLWLRGSRLTLPYNADALRDERDHVLIVESEKDVWIAWLLGYTAIAAPANAWRQAWCALVGHIKRVTVIADKDDAGAKSARKIKSMIARARIVSPPAGNDLHDWYMSNNDDRSWIND